MGGTGAHEPEVKGRSVSEGGSRFPGGLARAASPPDEVLGAMGCGGAGVYNVINGIGGGVVWGERPGVGGRVSRAVKRADAWSDSERGGGRRGQ